MKKKPVIERREKIWEMLAEEKSISVSRLLEELQVSDETLRKDLIRMEEHGLIRRTHGKITLLAKEKEEEMHVRTQENTSEKKRIAQEVLRHIPNLKRADAVVGLDVGSTTLEVAKLLVKEPSVAVVTNSLVIASLYAKEGNANINCTGGILRGTDQGFYGEWARENLERINMVVSILGTPGIHEGDGVGAISFDDKEIKQLYVRNSHKVIVVFDSTKCAYPSMMDSVPWEDVDVVISDAGMPKKDQERIGAKTKLIIV